MRCNQIEIIEGILEHVRRQGGDPSEWCVGTAKDSALLEEPPGVDGSDGLIYREAYTSYAAAEVVDRLRGSGLLPDHTRLCTRGDFVYVYRRTAAKPAASVPDGTRRGAMVT